MSPPTLPTSLASPLLKVAVVTGGHQYDVPNFHQLFRRMPDLDVYIQHIEDFAASSQAVRDAYEVVLFYIMMVDGPIDEGLPDYAGQPKSALAHLGETKQGIFMLHHALLAYPAWPIWNELVGIQQPWANFGYQHDETLQVNVADPIHPITKDISSWEMIDETYRMNEPDDNSHPLLTVEHERSMRAIAWTRQYKQSRVFCLQSGHDHQTWQNEQFCEIVDRGILWCAGRL
jgi:type 1 glutamine amidotransferase